MLSKFGRAASCSLGVEPLVGLRGGGEVLIDRAELLGARG
jgi:hypothetical protein